MVASEVPPWIGALDVLVVAGDDAVDPVLVSAAATGTRRGARVIVVAPQGGPLQDVAAGRAVVLEPRLQVPDDFGLARYFSAGLAILRVVDPGMRVDIAGLADVLDAEALRNSAGRELFTNPAKTLADRMAGRDVVLCGDNAAVAGARPARRRRCCSESATNPSPPWGSPTSSWPCMAESPVAQRITRLRYSTTRNSTARSLRGSAPSSSPLTTSASPSWPGSRATTVST